nr:MAG TPA: tail completion protein [Bacteriophage sp.]
MIEKTVISYLREKFPNEIVEAEVPRGMPDRFITVEKTGARQIGIGLFTSTIAVQSWDRTSRMRTAELSNAVCKVLWSLPDKANEVTRVRGADYDFTDVTTKRYRYQAVFEIIHY